MLAFTFVFLTIFVKLLCVLRLRVTWPKCEAGFVLSLWAHKSLTAVAALRIFCCNCVEWMFKSTFIFVFYENRFALPLLQSKYLSWLFPVVASSFIVKFYCSVFEHEILQILSTRWNRKRIKKLIRTFFVGLPNNRRVVWQTVSSVAVNSRITRLHNFRRIEPVASIQEWF